MTKWEHRYLPMKKGGKEFMEQLDSLGKDGWELVAITAPFLSPYEAWLKRPTDGESGDSK